MSTTTGAAYWSRFTGRIAPVGNCIILESKPFQGYSSSLAEKAYCIKDRVLLDSTCDTVHFFTNTNYDRIVKVERGNAKYMEVNALWQKART